MPSHYSEQEEDSDYQDRCLERWQKNQDKARVVTLMEEALSLSNRIGGDDMIFIRMQLRQMIPAMRAS